MKPPRQPRAEGEAGVAAALRDGRSRIADLHERGSAKFRTPRAFDHRLDVVLLNTAGGVTGGDALSYSAEARRGSWITLATQTAERAYRAQPGETGRVSMRLRAGPGATLEWLAQETIFFDRCDFARTTEIDIAADSHLLVVEPRVFGREAMGETVKSGAIREDLRLRRDGKLIYADAFRVEGDISDALARPSALNGARAFASILYAAPDAESRLEEARARLPAADSGASAFDGLISARIVSPDGHALRRSLERFLREFRPEPLPRVWEM